MSVYELLHKKPIKGTGVASDQPHVFVCLHGIYTDFNNFSLISRRFFGKLRVAYYRQTMEIKASNMKVKMLTLSHIQTICSLFPFISKRIIRADNSQ